MDSAKNISWIIPFKKFGKIRVKGYCKPFITDPFTLTVH